MTTPNLRTKERQVESYLKKVVEKGGGLCVKLNPVGYVGLPDRLCLLPGGVVMFVEVKRPKGGVVAPLQMWWRNKLIGLGLQHVFVKSTAEIDEIFGEKNEPRSDHRG